MRLNLGCGNYKLEGYTNVDSQAFCEPDEVVDLESFPWPWPDNSISEIYISHVLEHLGATPAVYLQLMQEMWRVCKPDAKITIIVPHPRSDHFLADPTHVRPITVQGLSLFDQTLNRQWIERGDSSTPLGLYLGIDFTVEDSDVEIMEPWLEQVINGSISEQEFQTAVRCYYNVIREITIILRARKPV